MATALVLLLGAGVASASEGTAGAEPNMTHRMMVLVLQLGVILFVAKLGARLFQKLRLPGVLGEIVGGIAAGPHLLGHFPLPAMPGGLFPAGAEFPITPELYGFCSVAAVVLLFTVGLETDVGLFMRYSVAGTLVGLGGVVVSFLLGDLVTVAFSRYLFGHAVGFFSPQALFLGVMSTATSVGITARLLSERKRMDSPEGVTILAGAVIDDVLGIVLLAICMGVISASQATGRIDWGHIGLISLKAVGIWLGATAVGLFATHRISLLLKWFRDRGTIAVMALGLGLILAGLFEEAGLAMIIGAYVMGLSLSRADVGPLIREKLESVVAFLVPVFFVVMGMLVDVRALAAPRVLLFGACYTALAVVAKIIGCGAPCLFRGFNLRGALRVGVGMLPRGEVALIVAGIGLAAGIVNRDVFGVGVLMTLATTLAAPPVLLAMFRGDRPGLRRPAAAGEDTAVEFAMPSGDAAELCLQKLLAVFEDEGFFVHALDRDAGIYQARTNRVAITVRMEATRLVFDCRDADLALVHTAMFEVVADLGRMVAELRKPLDAAAVARKVQAPVQIKRPMLKLSDHMSPRTMVPRLAGTTKAQAIGELIRTLEQAGLLRDAAAAQEAVWARESTGSTGMQHGVALPHGKTDVVDRVVAAVGLKPEGLDFDSVDGHPAQIVVLVLSPVGTAGPHVQFLATISQALDEPGRRALLACDTAQAMYEAVTRRG